MNNHLEIYGYHGTSQTKAESILADGFRMSDNNSVKFLAKLGQTVESIRASFVEGERLFPDSAKAEKFFVGADLNLYTTWL
jgi:hypothetical protein